MAGDDLDARSFIGVGVSPGLGAGVVHRYDRSIPVPAKTAIYTGDAKAENTKALHAMESVAADLETRGMKAGGLARDVLAAQAMMARDPEVTSTITRRIAAGVAAPRAVYEGFQPHRTALAASSEYLAARVADLDDVRDRVIARLLGLSMPDPSCHPTEPYVLVATDLAPADTALLDPKVVVAIVTAEGGPTSHTAILARALGVPAVVACRGSAAISNGARVLVDGSKGTVHLSPADDAVQAAQQPARIPRAAPAPGTGPTRLASGELIPVLATIGGPAELPAAKDAGAEGVGLFRTEFLYLDRDAEPSEDEQEAAYRPVLEAFPGGRVVFRTLDAGADKALAFLPASTHEPNPALGLRAIRAVREEPGLLERQLRAISRAAQGTSANLMVMAPMVAEQSEAAWFAGLCRAAGLNQVGIMVEIPSAALRARDLVGEVEFFSIGTNDLAQYCFAADRQLGGLAHFQDPWQPALLDLVLLTTAAAELYNKGCGVCGEAASDPALACVLVGLGVQSLSVGSAAIPWVRAALSLHTMAQCKTAAQAALRAFTAQDAREHARAALPGLSDLDC